MLTTSTRTAKLSSFAVAISLTAAGLALGSTAAYAEPISVTATDIVAGPETQATYNGWHAGYGTSYETTDAGLVVTGAEQILFGDDAGIDASLETILSGLSINVVDGSAWYQVPLFYGDEVAGSRSFTTLRLPTTESTPGSAVWTVSRAIIGSGDEANPQIPANSAADVAGILAALDATPNVSGLDPKVIGYGFYVEANTSATVASLSANGNDYNFVPAAPAAPEVPEVPEVPEAPEIETVNVPATTIRPDESVYAGWHQGAVGGSLSGTTDGLSIVGKSQILFGDEAAGSDLEAYAASLAIDSTGPVWYQLPVTFGPAGESFTTLRLLADAPVTADSVWTTSRQVDSIPANGQGTIAEFAAAMGELSIIGHGFFVDEALSATVVSFTANGVRTLFTPPVDGAGIGIGLDSEAPAASNGIRVKQGEQTVATLPAGILPGNYDGTLVLVHDGAEVTDSAVTFTTNADGSATVTIDVTSDYAVDNTYRVLFQGSNDGGYFWSPTEITVGLPYGAYEIKDLPSSKIRPDETVYSGWHEGATGGSFVGTDNGLAITGKSQILFGDETLDTDLETLVSTLAIEAEGEVWYQIPVTFGADNANFTTLRLATSETITPESTWTTSRAVGSIPANGSATLAELIAELGEYSVIGYGFFVDEGQTATVKSFSADEIKTVFLKPVAGAGYGDGSDTTPPTATASLNVKRGEEVTLTMPHNVFDEGETGTAILHSTPVEVGSFTAAADGSVTTSITIPDDAEYGEHRVLLQASNNGAYVWESTTLVVTSDDDDDDDVVLPTTPAQPGTIPGNPTQPGSNAGNPTQNNGGGLAVTGVEHNVLLATGVLALIAGAALTILRRRGGSVSGDLSA